MKNIIFFLTDQQHFRTLNENGCQEAVTPNMDKLAREGLNFQKHFVANPVCSPSRGAIWSGRMPSMNGLYANGCSLSEEVPTLIDLFNDNGYATGHFGKLHLEPTMTEGVNPNPFGFQTFKLGEGDQWLTHDHYNLWLREQDPDAFFHHYQQMANEGHMKAYADNLPEELSHNAWVTQESIDWMKQQAGGDKPFFLSMGYFDPHHAWNSFEPYATDWAYRAVSPPKYDPKDNASKPEHWGEMDDCVKDPFWMTSIIRSYHAMISHLDDCLGRLLTALEASGELENTVVIFSSDHGEFMGNHGRIFKGPYLCDDILQAPLIVWDGAQRNQIRGSVSGLTSALDFYPTFATLAGISSIPETDGQAFLDHELTLFPQGERDFVLSEWRQHPPEEGLTGDILSVRMPTERYVRYANTGEEEYYRHEEDPYELRNLADDPSTSERRAELAALLDREAPPPGDHPDPVCLW